ncbi:MAG: hypothetical protein R2706_08065 [Acidimicrobiales bacterium]
MSDHVDLGEDIGEIFNLAAADMATIDDADAGRESGWFAAFDAMDDRNAELATAADELADDPVLAPLIAEIKRDIPLAGMNSTTSASSSSTHRRSTNANGIKRSNGASDRAYRVKVDSPKPRSDRWIVMER